MQYLKYLLNPTKLTKNKTIYLSLIIKRCMNIHKSETKFRNFRGFIYIRCSSMIDTERITSKLKRKN